MHIHRSVMDFPSALGTTDHLTEVCLRGEGPKRDGRYTGMET